MSVPLLSAILSVYLYQFILHPFPVVILCSHPFLFSLPLSCLCLSPFICTGKFFFVTFIPYSAFSTCFCQFFILKLNYIHPHHSPCPSPHCPCLPQNGTAYPCHSVLIYCTRPLPQSVGGMQRPSLSQPWYSTITPLVTLTVGIAYPQPWRLCLSRSQIILIYIIFMQKRDFFCLFTFDLKRKYICRWASCVLL